jgi:hypothetical protein
MNAMDLFQLGMKLTDTQAKVSLSKEFEHLGFLLAWNASWARFSSTTIVKTGCAGLLVTTSPSSQLTCTQPEVLCSLQPRDPSLEGLED